MQRGFGQALFAFLVCISASIGARADLLGVNLDSGQLYSVSTSNAALSPLSTTIPNLAEIEFASDGTLYGFTSSAVTPQLFKINPGTGAATLVGTLGNGFVFEGGLAFSPTGTAYGTNSGDAGAPGLFTINLSTGAATAVGTISGGGHDINGLAYRSDGKLIGLDRVTNALLVIDPTTAVSSVLAAVPTTVGAVGGMTEQNGVFFYNTAGPGGSVAGSNSLYSFDPFTGASTLIGDFNATITSGNGISGIAGQSAPAGVPEPGVLTVLGGLAVTGGIVIRRRRK